MDLRIAIQPDEVVHWNGERQSYSERWTELARNQDIEVVPVDVFSRNVIAQIAGCDAFLWRFDPSAHPRLYARRLLYAVEKGLGMPVFPSLRTSWHSEDKVGQSYLLTATGVPTPGTDVFWTREDAEKYCDIASYPFVLKLAIGYQAANVRLVRNRDDAQYYIDQMFGPGVVALGYGPASQARLLLRRLRTALEIVKGRNPNSSTPEAEQQHGYFLAQEFLPGNKFDTRVTIIGNRAFAYSRNNRPGDFRASGSHSNDWDSHKVGEDAVRLAYRVAHNLRVQTTSVDILRRGYEAVICEVSFSYPSWSVRECPGHWVLDGEPGSGALSWIDGSMEPADAIFADFVAQVRQSKMATGIANADRTGNA